MHYCLMYYNVVIRLSQNLEHFLEKWFFFYKDKEFSKSLSNIILKHYIYIFNVKRKTWQYLYMDFIPIKVGEKIMKKNNFHWPFMAFFKQIHVTITSMATRTLIFLINIIYVVSAPWQPHDIKITENLVYALLMFFEILWCLQRMTLKNVKK